MHPKNNVFEYCILRIHFCIHYFEFILILCLIKALNVIKCPREYNPIMVAIFMLTNMSMVTLFRDMITYPINVSH